MTHGQAQQPAHPLRRWHLVEIASLAVGGTLLVLTGWWSLDDPRHETGFKSDTTTRIQEADAQDMRAPDLIAIDPSAFDVALWNPPAPPPPPPPAAPQQREIVQRIPPLNVQLLAIVRQPDDGSLAAMLYDPKTDTLYTIRAGEEILGHTISSIEGETVLFEAASTKTRLSLMPEDRP